MAFKVFVDSDVLLDLFLERKPFFFYSGELLSLAETEKVNLYTSSVIINNLFYFISKEKNKYVAKESIRILISILTVLPVGGEVIELALDSDFSDFEDALQYYTAVNFGCDQIITRNLKHYKRSQIPVLTAEQFLDSMN